MVSPSIQNDAASRHKDPVGTMQTGGEGKGGSVEWYVDS